MLVPADRYKPSPRKMPGKLPIIEYDIGAQIRKVTDKGCFSYRGHDYHIGKAFAGFKIEVRVEEPRERLEAYFGKHRVYQGSLS